MMNCSEKKSVWLFVGLACVSIVTGSIGAGPEWWTNRGVTDQSNFYSDYSPANAGQLKHVASMAAAEFNATLPGGAGNAIDAMVGAFSTAPSSGTDFDALNVGQLKAVAKPFYDRLMELGRRPNGAYPWVGVVAVDDYAMANVGQLKNLFAFEPSIVESNAPAAPLRLFHYKIGGETQIGWVDGSTNELGFLVEYTVDNGLTWVGLSSAPADSSGVATNAPLMNSYFYRIRSFNSKGVSKFVYDDRFGERDEDGDGLTNQEEADAVYPTSPIVADTDNDGVSDNEDGMGLDPSMSPARPVAKDYAVINISDVGDGMVAIKINDNNQVLFVSGHITSQSAWPCRLWDNGQVIPLPDDFLPIDINNNGMVVGTMNYSYLAGIPQAATWETGSLAPTPVGGYEVAVLSDDILDSTLHPVGIDDEDRIVGYTFGHVVEIGVLGQIESEWSYYVGTESTGGVATALGNIDYIPAIGDVQLCFPAAVNSNGIAVGRAFDDVSGSWWEWSNSEPFLSNGAIQALPHQGSYVKVTAISDGENPTVLGEVNSMAGSVPTIWSKSGGAWTWSGLGGVDVEGNSYYDVNGAAWAINRRLEVLGWFIGEVAESDGNSAPVLVEKYAGNLWRNGLLLDVNPRPGWEFTPSDINNKGWIVGQMAQVDELGEVTGSYQVVVLAPVEAAPDIVAVNTNFDEGKIDPSTGYAIPDAALEEAGVSSLRAVRTSVDGAIAMGEVVTRDLHKGFFGVRPGQLSDDVFVGAEVTIIKLPRTDDSTGLEETGEVRFHATLGKGVSAQHWNIPSGYDVNNGTWFNLVPLLYAQNPVVPREGVTYWIEGVKPGKITLEYRIAKQGVELLRYEQTFNVCTQKSPGEWRQEVDQQLLLQTSGLVDFNEYKPSRNFSDNVPHIKQVYAYYSQVFGEHPTELMWTGMAKLAGGTVFAGLSDAQAGRDLISAGVYVSPFGSLALSYALKIKDFQTQLMVGNRDIYYDLAWQHRAYLASGKGAIVYAAGIDDEGSVIPVNLVDWDEIDQGIRLSDEERLRNATLGLLRREQEFVVQPVYEAIKEIDIPGGLGYDDALSWLAENPIPRGKPFSELVSGNLAVFADRWEWVHEPGGTEGMYQLWTGTSGRGLSASERLSFVGVTLTDRAKVYAWFKDKVP